MSKKKKQSSAKKTVKSQSSAKKTAEDKALEGKQSAPAKKTVKSRTSAKKTAEDKALEGKQSAPAKKTVKGQSSAKKTAEDKALEGKQSAPAKKTVKSQSSAKKPALKEPAKKKSRSALKKRPARALAPPQNSLAGKKQKSGGKTAIFSLSACEKELQKLLDQKKQETLILKDMKGRVYCMIESCDYPAVIEGYCRIHFFGLFKRIKKRKQILEEDFLTKQYDFLVKKRSPAVFDHLLKDLHSDRHFQQAIKKITDEETEGAEAEGAFPD